MLQLSRLAPCLLPFSIQCSVRTIRSAAALAAHATAKTIREAQNPFAVVAEWQSGKALSDLKQCNIVERPVAKANLYERYLQQYALYDTAPIPVIRFFYANKPASVLRTATQYNVLLHTELFRAKSAEGVQRLRAEMRENNTSCNAVGYQFLIGASVAAGKMHEAAALFEEMLSANVTPNSVHHSLMIDGYAVAGNVALAELWMQRLEKTIGGETSCSVTVLSALQKMYLALDPAARKPHDARLSTLSKQLTERRAVQLLELSKEASGVQWSLPRKAVTSTGGDDKGKAVTKGVNAPKKNAKK